MGAIILLDLETGGETERALRAAAPDLESSIIACYQTARASAQVAHADVLVAAPSCLSQQGIRFLQQVHETYPGVIIMILAPKNGPQTPVRDLVRIGASDFVRFPAAPRTLRAALGRALDMAHPRAEANARGLNGRVLTVTSPTGGCGKTFFATNLAYRLATRTGKRVALIDLDLQFGEVVTSMRLRPEYTIADLLAGETDREMTQQMREFMVSHSSGVEVLAAPKDPAQADAIGSPDITRIVAAAKELYHYVIVDTPAALTEPVLAAFDLSEQLVVLATLDLPSVKNLGVFLQTLDRLKISQEQVSLIMNKAERDVGLTTGEVQRLFPQGFIGVLPYSKEVSRSLNTGRVVVESAPSSDVGRATSDTIRRILPDEVALDGAAPAQNGGSARPNVFARMFGRRAAALGGAR
jgi:pilus assembly protein CpaE